MLNAHLRIDPVASSICKPRRFLCDAENVSGGQLNVQLASFA
jgi:hypothetical protein